MEGLATPRLVRSMVAMLACTLAFFIEWERPEFANRIDESLRDRLLQVTASTQPENRIVIIDITEGSLDEVGPWPWPRSRIADLVEILLDTYGAKAVGLDIVFPTTGAVEGDSRLASLAEHAPVVLAQVFDYTARNALILQGKPLAGTKPKDSQPALLAQGYIGNNPGFSRAACVGNIGYRPDSDGVLRRIPIRTRYAGLDFPHLAQAMITCGVEGHFISPATDIHGQWRIPYSRTMSSYTVIPAVEVLTEQAPPELIRGRYVLVGSSSLSLGDRVITPLAPITAGVMVHAVNLSGLLDLAEAGKPKSSPNHAFFVIWCVFSMVVAMICIARFSAWGSVLLLIGFAGAWGVIAALSLMRGAEWSLSAPLWAYFMLLLVGVPFEWWQTQRRSRGLLSMLSHYVARPVLHEILRRNMAHSLEPRLCQVTVLVADMENYTATISSLPLSEAAILTKDFLGCLTRPVLGGDGTLDKYTGDGLVAFWGAPLPCADQADRALEAAKKMLAEVSAFNTRWRSADHTPLRVRIGIESGTALVGDLGTDFRSTYTAVGDCINFASRLEEAARNLPTDIVMGPCANARLRQHKTRSMGSITLRGMNTPIEIFSAL